MVIKQQKLPWRDHPLDRRGKLRPLLWSHHIHRDFTIKEKVTVTTTDNGSNFVKAFSMFAEVQRTIEGSGEEENEDNVFINVTHILNEADSEEDYSLPPH